MTTTLRSDRRTRRNLMFNLEYLDERIVLSAGSSGVVAAHAAVMTPPPGTMPPSPAPPIGTISGITGPPVGTMPPSPAPPIGTKSAVMTPPPGTMPPSPAPPIGTISGITGPPVGTMPPSPAPPPVVGHFGVASHNF